MLIDEIVLTFTASDGSCHRTIGYRMRWIIFLGCPVVKGLCLVRSKFQCGGVPFSFLTHSRILHHTEELFAHKKKD